MTELSVSEKPQFILFKDVRYTSSPSPSPFMIIHSLSSLHSYVNKLLVKDDDVCGGRSAFKLDDLGLEIARIALPAAMALTADPIASLIDTAFIGQIGILNIASFVRSFFVPLIDI